MANPAHPNPPRPDVWEVPDLTDETKYFAREPLPRASILDRLIDSLEDADSRDDRNRLLRTLRRVVRFGDTNEFWEPYRFLGQGGYATAGLWVKRDGAGVIQDEIVVKEQEETQGDDTTKYREPGSVHPVFRGLLKEAAICKQMNESRCENIIHLRGYKYCTGRHNPVAPDRYESDHRATAPQRGWRRVAGARVTAGRRAQVQQPRDDGPPRRPPIPQYEGGLYRLYLEFAPHQTLDDLLNRYRTWNQWLPEPFLWHVFDSLAAALQVMAKGPERMLSSRGWTRATVGHWPPGTYVLHNDIKTSNIFLGYEQRRDDETDVSGGSAILGYPVIKLGDFGLADITGYWDADNVPRNEWKGTENYRAPEHRFYSIDWADPVNHNIHPGVAPLGLKAAEIQNPGFFYSNATNVWAVGKIMYDLLTTSRRRDLDAQVYYDFWSPPSRAHYNLCRRHFLARRQLRDPRYELLNGHRYHLLNPGPHYSNRLRRLIWKCLKPRIISRPTVDELRQETQEMLAYFEDIIAPPAPGRRPQRKPRRRARRAPPLQVAANAPHVFQDHTINQMPFGGPHGHTVDYSVTFAPGVMNWQQNFNALSVDASLVSRRRDVDSAWPDLQLPLPKFANDVALMGGNRPPPVPPAIANTYAVHNGRIWFNQLPPGGVVGGPQVVPAPAPLPPPQPGVGGGPGIPPGPPPPVAPNPGPIFRLWNFGRANWAPRGPNWQR